MERKEKISENSSQSYSEGRNKAAGKVCGSRSRPGWPQAWEPGLGRRARTSDAAAGLPPLDARPHLHIRPQGLLKANELPSPLSAKSSFSKSNTHTLCGNKHTQRGQDFRADCRPVRSPRMPPPRLPAPVALSVSPHQEHGPGSYHQDTGWSSCQANGFSNLARTLVFLAPTSRNPNRRPQALPPALLCVPKLTARPCALLKTRKKAPKSTPITS